MEQNLQFLRCSLWFYNSINLNSSTNEEIFCHLVYKNKSNDTLGKWWFFGKPFPIKFNECLESSESSQYIFQNARGRSQKSSDFGGEAFPWMCQEYFAHMVTDAWLTTFDFQKKEKVWKLNFLSGGGIWTSRGRRVSRMQRKSLETWELLGGILWLRPSLLNLFTLTRAF